MTADKIEYLEEKNMLCRPHLTWDNGRKMMMTDRV